MNYRYIAFFIISLSLATNIIACKGKKESKVESFSMEMETYQEVIPGAERVQLYYPLIDGKNVALVVNQTSQIQDRHIIDSLLDLEVNISRIFAPEHGFRGEADAGEKVVDGIDKKTNIPLISLYGNNKKPTSDQLSGVEVVVFDIQDVGARFYTYISTLHYVMEACAEKGIPVILLDRPNPNGHYIDGPIMEEKYMSFVGMHPVPVVYGMTIGEYGQMINGEKWLNDGVQCDLTVITVNNYDHNTFYKLPVNPSPNLPNTRSILLYPSLCFFEGTTLSVGRGTDKQFQVIGHPDVKDHSFSFTPVSGPGSKYPKHENELCYGLDLSRSTVGSLYDEKGLNMSYLIDYYKELSDQGKPVFNDNNFFEKLAGTRNLRQQLEDGKTEAEIKSTWKEGLASFNSIRVKYLLYQD